LNHSQIEYDHDAVLSNGMRFQGSTSYVWPTTEEIERDGGQVLAADSDGTPLVVAWEATGRFSFNGDRLEQWQIAAMVNDLEECLQERRANREKKKGFWVL
jgi:hypothetical protein